MYFSFVIQFVHWKAPDGYVFNKCMYVFFCTSNVSLYHVNRLKQYCFHPFHLSSLRYKHLEPVFRRASDVRISKREGFQIYFKPQLFIDTTLSTFRHKLLLSSCSAWLLLCRRVWRENYFVILMSVCIRWTGQISIAFIFREVEWGILFSGV